MADNNNFAYNVEFMSCVIDKADNLCVLDSDSHFCEFVGVHPSKIKQGKLLFHDLLVPQDRERIMQIICKKDSPHVYFDFYIKGKGDRMSLVHCTGVNVPDSSICHLTMVDVTRSAEREEELRARAKEMNHLIDLVTGGVCLFKVNQDMHFEMLYVNESCCKFFGTSKESFNSRAYRIDELIHPDDKSMAFQQIGMAMATKKPITCELRILPHKDKYIWCKMDAGIQKYDKDNCPIFHAIFSDITKIKQAEQEVDKQRKMLVSVLKNVPGPVFVTEYDDMFKLNIVSEDFLHLIGYTRVDIFEKFDGDLSRLISDKEVEIVKKSIENQKGNPTLKMTYSIKKKDGQMLTIIDRRKLIETQSGEKSMIGMLSDFSTMRFDADF